jgi:protein TonB
MNGWLLSLPGQSRQYAISWVASLLFHGLAMVWAFLFLSDLQLAPQPEPFRWEVAVVQASASKSAEQPSSAQATPAPPEPQPVDQPATEPQPVVQTRNVQTIQPVQQVIHREIREVKHVFQAAEAIPTVESVSQTAESVQAVQQAAVVKQTGESQAMTQEASQAPSSPPDSGPASPARVQQAAVTHLPVRSAPATKADYSWLADALWREVERLKRYPHIARMNRWEGRVVLRAVIRDDGRVMDLRVMQSSGYDILDQDALEVIRQASPLKLKHPLGQPQVTVQVPISYRLR